jgi:hypothetical protein
MQRESVYLTAMQWSTELSSLTRAGTTKRPNQLITANAVRGPICRFTIYSYHIISEHSIVNHLLSSQNIVRVLRRRYSIQIYPYFAIHLCTRVTNITDVRYYDRPSLLRLAMIVVRNTLSAPRLSRSLSMP